MNVGSLSLHDIVTPAGIVALGLIIRQFIEVAKGLAPLSWLDAGNERKATILLALVAYIAWFLAYQTDPATDVFTALGSWVAVSLAAMGANEAIDAGQQTLARTIMKQAPAALGITAAQATAALTPIAASIGVTPTAPQAPGDQDAEDLGWEHDPAVVDGGAPADPTPAPTPAPAPDQDPDAALATPAQGDLGTPPEA